jgi:23S rRNA (guanosine2251-2'-O)-methyltransferase
MIIYGKHSVQALTKWLEPNNLLKKNKLLNNYIESDLIKATRAIYILKHNKKSNKNFDNNLLRYFPSYLFKEVDRPKLNFICGNNSHQGIAVEFGQGFRFPNEIKQEMKLSNWLEYTREFGDTKNPLIIILDRLQDPHNIGAIIRTAEALGVNGIILPKNGSAPLNDTVHHISTGASLLIPIKWESNLVRTLQILKENNYWIISADVRGKEITENDISKGAWALIIGSESKGIKPILLKNSDFRLKLPLSGQTESLNASVSAAIFMYLLKSSKK